MSNSIPFLISFNFNSIDILSKDIYLISCGEKLFFINIQIQFFVIKIYFINIFK